MAHPAWTIRPRFVLTALMVFAWGSFVGVSPADIAASDGMLTEQEGLSVKDGVKLRGLLGFWRLDGDTTDASGNGYHGTLVGSPTEKRAKTCQVSSSVNSSIWRMLFWIVSGWDILPRRSGLQIKPK